MIGALTLAAVALLAWTYAGYHAFMWLLTRVVPARRTRPGAPTPWPRVTVVVSAYNEETVIAERIENLLDLDYPADRLEILVGSDGSSDRTRAIVATFEHPRVRLLAFPVRRGKTSVLNDLVARARGDVVVLTDANTFFRRDAVRELVIALWRHPSACAVVGRLDLRAAAAGGNHDGLYWRYETWLKTLESHFGAVLGANGAIYAFRPHRYRPLPTAAIVDDFLIPMLMRQHAGGEIVFVPTARAWETSPAGVRHELTRRVRIGAGDLQALGWTWRLLLPWRGMVALAYASHKVVRWLGPWLLLAALTGSLALADQPLYRGLLAAQLAAYALAAAAPALRGVPALGRAASVARFFVILNVGLALGWVRFVLGRQRPIWTVAPRAEPQVAEPASSERRAA
jgi:cellulose synthase/poly-beta-1,6-N-acetylglucosamine synthase-like glycosyltransferase